MGELLEEGLEALYDRAKAGLIDRRFSFRDVPFGTRSPPVASPATFVAGELLSLKRTLSGRSSKLLRFCNTLSKGKPSVSECGCSTGSVAERE